ncbi:MAG: hypothetical protein IPL09_05825 [Bacteroidetes bacterium]|jgi:hypothetical protein|nr:hypothetical protein [Bacteroidota bacterium]
MSKHIKLLACLLLLSIGSIQAQQFLKLTPVENSFTSKKPIASIYKNKSEINVILRNSSYDLVRPERNSYALGNLFNVIEKEFIRQGLNVKDASLFKLDKENTDNNVDIMIDLADADWVEITTNKFYDKNDKEKQTRDLEGFKMYGLKLDFRLVDVQSNEVIGFYTFGFTPCTQGCQVKIKGKGVVEFVDKKQTRYTGKYEMNKDIDEGYETFCKTVATSLAKVLKKNTEVESIFDETKEAFEKARKDVFKYFPVSYFFNNNNVGTISKSKNIYVSNFNGENIAQDIETVFSNKGFKITQDVSKADYFLFYYKGTMIKGGPDRPCVQFQFIDAKSLQKLAGAAYKFRRSDYIEESILLFVDSL